MAEWHTIDRRCMGRLLREGLGMGCTEAETLLNYMDGMEGVVSLQDDSARIVWCDPHPKGCRKVGEHKAEGVVPFGMSKGWTLSAPAHCRVLDIWRRVKPQDGRPRDKGSVA